MRHLIKPEYIPKIPEAPKREDYGTVFLAPSIHVSGEENEQRYQDDLQAYNQKYFPTRCIEWKGTSVIFQNKPDDTIYIKFRNGLGETPVIKSTLRKWNRDRLKSVIGWVDAETYETAKAEEEKFECLGKGWKKKDMPSFARFDLFYNNELGIEIYYYRDSHVEVVPKKRLPHNPIIPIELAYNDTIKQIIKDIERLN